MRISLATRAARACAAATLIFSLGLAPSYARMGGPGGASFARPAFGFGHPHFAARGFNRPFNFGHFGFHRFGPNRFDRFAFDRFGRFGFHRFNRFGFNRLNRFGFGPFDGNQLFVGGWGWGGWGGYPVPAAASEPIIAGGGAPPIIINIGAQPGPDAAGAGSGGCVTHKLMYDGDGNYVGEQQSSQC